MGGDDSYSELVEYLTQTLFKRVWIFHFENKISPNLRAKASPLSLAFLDEVLVRQN